MTVDNSVMNFLAHLHLAHLADSSLTGNLLADFVRGDPSDRWSPEIVSGIRMHRRLDALSDQLPEVLAAKQRFRPETRRVAPIALDVIWDHFLALHWPLFSPQQSLSQFCIQAQRVISPDLPNTPESFQQLNRLMWKQQWLERYAEATQLQSVFQQMAQRRVRLNSLADCYDDFVANYAQLEQLFWAFYPRIIKQAQENRL